MEPAAPHAFGSSPVISLIVPVYNTAPYLRACLESVLAQTYAALEILVTDDGSTDGSGAICDEYALRDGRIRVFHTENRGLSAARNYALDRATGELIAFLDSDDLMEPDALEKLEAVMRAYEADIAVCGILSFWKDRSYTSATNDEVPTVFEGDALSEQAASMDRLHLGAWNKLYRAALFCGVRFPEGKTYEDVATIYRVVGKARRAVLLDVPLVRYRKRAGSISAARSEKNLSDLWDAFYSKHEDLHKTGSAYADSPVLLTALVHSAARFRFYYYGFKPEEKARAADTMNRIRSFGCKNLKKIAFNKRIPTRLRLLYPFLLMKNGLLFRLLYALPAIRKLTERKGEYEP